MVYDELRRVAAAKLAGERGGQTLQPTALVHEAWLRLLGSDRQVWTDRTQFFRAAAEAMRRILIEAARRKGRLKRGAGHVPIALDAIEIPIETDPEKLLLVDEALSALSREDPRKAEVVKLRFFAGMRHSEIADILGLSEKTVKRDWLFAKAWLYDAIKSEID